MKWVLIVFVAIVALVLIVWVVGVMSPKDHVATITVRYDKPDSAVWAAVSDFEKVPDWNAAVTSVRRIADVDGRPAYREKYGGFEVTNVVRELVPNRRIVREILPEGAFSGSWTLELTPDGQATLLKITERGHVENPLFRAMMRFNDNSKTMRGYTEALGRRLGSRGEEVRST